MISLQATQKTIMTHDCMKQSVFVLVVVMSV